MGSTTPDLRAALDRDGFVVVPGLLPEAQVSAMRHACAHATAAARAGKWPHIRTMPKQFPPWPSEPGPEGIWGVQHLLHPDLPLPADVAADVFQRSYFDDGIVGAVAEIVGAQGSGDQLVMELYNLLVRPDRSDFALRWHRDDIPADASPEQEEERLCPRSESGGRARLYAHTQWNLPLYDDESLIVVPGSHKRARTPDEYRILAENPWADDLPDQMVVKLRPGDVVFYDNNILHRGVYQHAKERMTLHGSMSLSGKAEERARNVLQHGVAEWVARCDFSGLDEGLRQRAEGMRSRLLQMGDERQRSGKAVEYSQPD